MKNAKITFVLLASFFLFVGAGCVTEKIIPIDDVSDTSAEGVSEEALGLDEETSLVDEETSPTEATEDTEIVSEKQAIISLSSFGGNQEGFAEESGKTVVELAQEAHINFQSFDPTDLTITVDEEVLSATIKIVSSADPSSILCTATTTKVNDRSFFGGGCTIEDLGEGTFYVVAKARLLGGETQTYYFPVYQQ